MAFGSAVLTSFLNQLSGKTSYGPLPNCYIGLSTTTPASDGSNFTEPAAADGYARAIVGLYTSAASQAMGDPTVSSGVGTITNDAIIYFPEASASWGTVTYFGLFTSASATTPVVWGVLTSSATIAAETIPVFRAGQLTFTLQ